VIQKSVSLRYKPSKVPTTQGSIGGSFQKSIGRDFAWRTEAKVYLQRVFLTSLGMSLSEIVEQPCVP